MVQLFYQGTNEEPSGGRDQMQGEHPRLVPKGNLSGKIIFHDL